MMEFTNAQKLLLKNDINNDPVLSILPNTPDNNILIADAYNQLALPDFWVWRTFVSDEEIYSMTSPDSTTWNWTTYINRSQGERDAWRQILATTGGLNLSLANVRAAIDNIFSGAGGVNQRAFLVSIGRRKATRFEKLFANVSGGNNGSAATPATMLFEGNITVDDITAAREFNG